MLQNPQPLNYFPLFPPVLSSQMYVREFCLELPPLLHLGEGDFGVPTFLNITIKKSHKKMKHFFFLSLISRTKVEEGQIKERQGKTFLAFYGSSRGQQIPDRPEDRLWLIR